MQCRVVFYWQHVIWVMKQKNLSHIIKTINCEKIREKFNISEDSLNFLKFNIDYVCLTGTSKSENMQGSVGHCDVQ